MQEKTRAPPSGAIYAHGVLLLENEMIMSRTLSIALSVTHHGLTKTKVQLDGMLTLNGVSPKRKVYKSQKEKFREIFKGT